MVDPPHRCQCFTNAGPTNSLVLTSMVFQRIVNTFPPVVILGKPETSGLHEAAAPQYWLTLLGPDQVSEIKSNSSTRSDAATVSF